MFGFCDVATGGIIAREVENILALYEPRIDDIIVEAEPRPANSEFELTVSYKIVGQAQKPDPNAKCKQTCLSHEKISKIDACPLLCAA